MSEKLSPLEELANKATELSDDAVDAVAGGEYTREEWRAMSTEERQAAQKRSMAARILGEPCELDRGVPHP